MPNLVCRDLRNLLDGLGDETPLLRRQLDAARISERYGHVRIAQDHSPQGLPTFRAPFNVRRHQRLPPFLLDFLGGFIFTFNCGNCPLF